MEESFPKDNILMRRRLREKQIADDVRAIERAKCAAEHYTREEVKVLMCKAISMALLGDEESVAEDPSHMMEALDIADRILREAKP